jgi:hypothetical protein
VTVPAPKPEERRTRSPISRRQRVAFLKAIQKGYSATNAAKVAGRHLRSFQKIRARDPVFAAAWAVALESGQDVLRDRVRELALEGVQEVVEVVDQAGVVIERRVTRRDDVRAVQLAAQTRLPEYAAGGGSHVTILNNATAVAGEKPDRSASIESGILVLLEAGSVEGAARILAMMPPERAEQLLAMTSAERRALLEADSARMAALRDADRRDISPSGRPLQLERGSE